MTMSSTPRSPGPFAGSYDPVRWWAAMAPDRIALVEPATGERLSYAQFSARADTWANYLRSHGVRPGDRIALLAPNCADTCALLFAAIRVGAALVPLNWRLAAGELQAIMADARPALALHHPSMAPPAAEVEGRTWYSLNEVATGPSSPATARPTGASPYASADHTADAGDAALILYTSGSTGRPKGVVLPHRQLLFNAVATCAAWELGPDDVAPISTPLFHTGGWNVFATPLWHCGGRVVLMDRFDPDTFLRILDDEGCTVVLAVPTQLVMLRAAADWGRPLPTLRRIFSGGAPCPQPLAADVRAAGYTLREGYGLTECGPNCFAITDADACVHPGTIGRPIMFLQARLCDDAGSDVPDGDVGELWLRGPQLFAGYFNDPVRTADAVTPDGWLRTGDLARRDVDGLFAIAGRRREMYISGGENVFPAEVEAALAECPGIVDVAVIGVADETWGEVGHAFVVASDASLAADDVVRFARVRLAGYKVPRRISLLAALPRLGSGKVDRRALLQRSIPEVV